MVGNHPTADFDSPQSARGSFPPSKCPDTMTSPYGKPPTPPGDRLWIESQGDQNQNQTLGGRDSDKCGVCSQVIPSPGF